MADYAPTASIRAVGKRNNKLKYQNIRYGTVSVREQICYQTCSPVVRLPKTLFCEDICQFWVQADDGLSHKVVYYWEKEKSEKLLTVMQR